MLPAGAAVVVVLVAVSGMNEGMPCPGSEGRKSPTSPNTWLKDWGLSVRVAQPEPEVAVGGPPVMMAQVKPREGSLGLPPTR